MGRAPCCDKANVKRGPWSPDEDETLKSYIQTHGTGGNWIALPQKIGLKRCGKSCRLRWLNYLRPNIKHGGFTEDEDNLICSLFLSIGSRWSIIAAQLPGRTDNDIKNYWNTRLRKKLLGRQRREQRETTTTTSNNSIMIRDVEEVNSQSHHAIINNLTTMSPYPHATPFQPDNISSYMNSPPLVVEPITFPCYDDMINNDHQNLNFYASAQLLSDHQHQMQFSSNYVPAFDHHHPPMPHQQQEHDELIMDRWPGDVTCLLYPSLC